MDILNYIVLILLTWILIKALVHKSSPTKKPLPPGPISVPIIGNLLQLGDKPHKSLAKLAEAHGPIMKLNLGQVTTIVISSASAAKQILQNHDVSFCNRMVPDPVRATHHDQYSPVWLPVNPLWRNLRKITNSYIFTTQKLDENEHLRRRKISQLIDFVKESCLAGRVIDIGQAAFSTIVNLISNTIFSVDLADPSSESTREFKELVWNIMVEGGKPNVANYFPFLQKIDPQGRRRRMEVYFQKLLNLLGELIDQRVKQRQQREGFTESKDMLDTLLNLGVDEIDKNQLEHLFADLFAAGAETTSNTVEWAMAELIRNPEKLSKARLELDQTIGKGKLIEESDVSRLPYLQAIVKETFRLHPPAPLLIPRKSSTEVEICGYRVPEGAQVLVNAWAIGRDEGIFENPKCFIPERFLGSDVDVKGRHFELIPFGGGRRICPGLPLAMRMLYLMIGALIHGFDWKLEGGDDVEKMNMDDKFGITAQMAQPLRVVPVAVIY